MMNDRRKKSIFRLELNCSIVVDRVKSEYEILQIFALYWIYDSNDFFYRLYACGI